MAFVLNVVGGSEVLKMIAAEEVSALAGQVAAAAGQGAVIETKTSKTRFVAAVKVPADMQAKDGTLSRAASEVGLEINAYPKRAVRAEEPKAPRAPKVPKKQTTRGDKRRTKKIK